MKKIWALSLLSLAVLAGCNTKANSELSKAGATGDDIIVTSEAGNITKEELYQTLKTQYGSAVLKDMVNQKVMEKKYPVTPEEIKKDLERAKKDFPDEKSFEEAIRSQGFDTPDKVNEAVKKSLMNFKAVTDGVTVTEEEMKKKYETEKTQIKASHILVDDEKLAKELLQKIKNGESFEELAKKYSKDTQSAKNGGSLGYFGKGKMIPPFEQAAFALKNGEVSDIVQTQFGYHIIKKMEDKVDTYEELKDTIENQLYLEKAKDYEQVMEKARQEMKVQIKDKDLEKTFQNENSQIPPSK